MLRFGRLRSLYLVIFLISATGGGLRLALIFNDFWLDEIWSLKFAEGLHSPMDAFTQIHHDNNHWLNTLFMYLLGDQTEWFLYRLLALFLGIASIGLAGLIASRRGRLESLVAVILFTFSYLQTLYSTEARG